MEYSVEDCLQFHKVPEILNLAYRNMAGLLSDSMKRLRHCAVHAECVLGSCKALACPTAEFKRRSKNIQNPR